MNLCEWRVIDVVTPIVILGYLIRMSMLFIEYTDGILFKSFLSKSAYFDTVRDLK